MNSDKIIELLKRTELFAPLPDELLSKIGLSSTVLTFPPGQQVIRKGAEGDRMYLITRGSVKVHDDQQVVAEFKSGEVVGELALLDKGPRSMNVTTLEETDVLSVDRESFYRLLKDRPDMVEKIIAILTQRLRNQNLRLVESLVRREEELTALVEDRTKDLHDRNLQLKDTLEQLQSAQQQLIMAEKMASLVQLTVGIAHEIQNPLNFVINFSALAKDVVEELRVTEDPAERNLLLGDLALNIAKIHQHGLRADSTIKSMLMHSRTATGEKQLSDLSHLISEILRLAYQGFRTSHPTFHCRLEFKSDDSVPKVPVIQQDFNRVLLNLFNNAFYAMDLRRTTAEKSGDFSYDPLLKVGMDFRQGWVDIHIKDNGNGIPVDIRDKVFNPFFTTKPSGLGTGLGLSLSYDIITKSHGGKLALNSVANEGAEFIVSLPVT